VIIDGRSVPEGTTFDADVCIVGSGFAGLALAQRLGQRSQLRVVVVESGGLRWEEATADLARGEVVGLPYYPLHETRVRAFGGTSASWGGVCTPLEPNAFRPRPWLNSPGWPIDQAELNAYSDEALEFCGVDRKERDEVDRENEIALSTTPLDLARLQPGLMYNSRPVRLAMTCLPAMRASESVRVLLHSTATELQANESAGHVDSLTVRCLSGNGFSVTARTYVLAGGGIENARLLLTSRGSSSAGLANSSGAVGACFQEHPRARSRYRVRSGVTPLAGVVGSGASGTLRFSKVALPEEVQQAEGLLTFHANLQAGYLGELTHEWEGIRRLGIRFTRPWNEMPYFHAAGGGRLGLRAKDVLAAARRPDVALLTSFSVVFGPARFRRFVEIYCGIEQLARPENRIELGAELDPFGIPRPRIHWAMGEVEERTYKRGLQSVLAELEKLEPGIGSAAVEEGDGWPDGVVGTWHHMGTTRMDPDPGRGVVDKNCRTHDVDNLFVAGGSVFPTSASLAPSLTIVELSMRLADHLAAHLA
jgi:choline dehydrogenase-like flavoprotein